ncbi:MAG: ARMT1-like domain-containing protein, partial [Bacteroidales bacterium]|nr:ARMT1-like domain-containing protein [Bacteroidales bacterium]
VITSFDSFDTALRLAIAGNIIDYGITDDIDLEAALAGVFINNFKIDDSLELKQDLLKAKKVLYLGDNCGEIVFDKLFIETIMHPDLTYVVRGSAIINDAIMEDAIYIGMESATKVISNGYDAPSTILEQCSQEFVKAFDSADVIISKGQGNLDGLFGKTDKTIYFLLMVKCDVIADNLGVKKGDFVVKKQALRVT